MRLITKQALTPALLAALGMLSAGCEAKPEAGPVKVDLPVQDEPETEQPPRTVPEPVEAEPEIPEPVVPEPVVPEPRPEPRVEKHLALGDAAFARGEFEIAVEEYTAAIRLDPETAAAYYSRGGSFGRLNRMQEAIDDLTRAIEVDRDYAMAYTGRAYLRQRRGENDLARKDYERAVQLDPEGEAGRIARKNLQTLEAR